MSDSLRDQLLGLGFKPAPKPDKPANKSGQFKPSSKSGQPQHRQHAAKGVGETASQARHAKHHTTKQSDAQSAAKRSEIDLAKAYAIRAQKEKDERMEAERVKQEEARVRREARIKLAELLQGQALNAQDADIARHFPYGGKIKRIYVTAAQLKALNAGELGVVQNNGRYVLVQAAVLAQAAAVFAPAVALKIDPDAVAQDDPYADPQYQVPDDLVW